MYFFSVQHAPVCWLLVSLPALALSSYLSPTLCPAPVQTSFSHHYAREAPQLGRCKDFKAQVQGLFVVLITANILSLP